MSDKYSSSPPLMPPITLDRALPAVSDSSSSNLEHYEPEVPMSDDSAVIIVAFASEPASKCGGPLNRLVHPLHPPNPPGSPAGVSSRNGDNGQNVPESGLVSSSPATMLPNLFCPIDFEPRTAFVPAPPATEVPPKLVPSNRLRFQLRTRGCLQRQQQQQRRACTARRQLRAKLVPSKR